MTKKCHIFLLLLLTLTVTEAFSQYPKYFTHDNENGLPSNEVYSLLQDKQGFIWIGCDAGLFKFDGVRYTAFKSNAQNSKSVTGLTVSASGKIYCHNFQAQIFFVENDTLKELLHPFPKYFINNLATDIQGNIYATHFGGISRYSEKSKKWTN